MANSCYQYVRKFEDDPVLLPGTYIVVRIDGKGFHKFTTEQRYGRPNDWNGLNLMNIAASKVMRDLPDVMIAYGQSDEYSFVLKPSTTLFKRRGYKISSTICSIFTAQFVYEFENVFEDNLKSLPSFDARIVCYPTLQHVRDYLAWRQVDCHINNLFNTTFYALIKHDNMTAQEAQTFLKTTNSGDKNELLFQRGINYNNENPQFRKGTILVWREMEDENGRMRRYPTQEYCDLIKDDFWEEPENSYLVEDFTPCVGLRRQNQSKK
ncbi:hypothetical protein PCE1_002156 [Barthelona sp. PCE]